MIYKKGIELSTYCNKITVGFVGTMAEHYIEHGVPFLRSLNINPYRININNMKYISSEFNQKIRKSILKKGDVVVVRTGYPGTSCVIGKDFNGTNCSDLVIIRPNPKKLSSRYLVYIFNSNYGVALITGNTVGAAQQHFNITVAKRLKLPIPPLPIQKKIAAVLSAYDDLIENNNRRIAILEKMAEEVYREWFVRLRFPGHEKVKMVKGVPEGWEVKTVDELIKRIQVGKKYENKTALERGKVPILDQGQSGIIGFHNDEPGVIATEEKPVIVFANHTCYQRLIYFSFSAIQNVLPFISNQIVKSNIFWLHYATKDLIEFSEYKGHWPEFCKKNLYYPGFPLTESFGIKIKPLLIKVKRLKTINTQISNIRDRLLFRLMSGKIDVEHLDIQFPESMMEESVDA